MSLHKRRMAFAVDNPNVCKRPDKVIQNIVDWLYGIQELEGEALPFTSDFVADVLVLTWEAYCLVSHENQVLKNHSFKSARPEAIAKVRSYKWRLKAESNSIQLRKLIDLTNIMIVTGKQ